MSNRITIVDYDSGNLRSVQKALESLGAEAILSRDPQEVADAPALVLPGQGAFRDCAEKLQSFGLWKIVKKKIAEDIPFLGICVGFQLLFDESEEHGRTPGFGVIPGKVVRFPHEHMDGDERLKVPHMGWNRLHKVKEVDVLREVAEGSYVYFVHSYYPVVEDDSVIATTTDYGYEFVSSVARGNLYACQFHPEKSQKVGLSILRAFLEKAQRSGS